MPVIQLRRLPEVSTANVRFEADISRITGRGFSLDYQSIVIHAVSRGCDEDAYLYCQLDGLFPGTSTEDSDDSGDDEQFAELRFYPANEQTLDDMFKAMSECAALNPDQDESDNEEEEDLYHSGNNQEDYDRVGVNGDKSNTDSAICQLGSFDPSGFITSPDQLDQLTPEGRAVLAHLESVISSSCNAEQGQNDGRFDDAPEDTDSDVKH
ncbi:Methylosome subunit pICln [Coemansia sp. RSA 986]|nr:Methylosome subunit pICln [Coemansia sp. RSA 986]